MNEKKQAVKTVKAVHPYARAVETQDGWCIWSLARQLVWEQRTEEAAWLAAAEYIKAKRDR